jgi:phosphate transport system substrate-binding protein
VVCAGAPLFAAPTRHDAVPPAARTLLIWGNRQMAGLTTRWQEGFRARHPGVSFETRLMGTGTGMAGIYTGVADVAFMGRECTPKEIMAFEWVFRYKPTRVEVATGSVDVPGHSPALVVFVHEDNPLSRLTLAQLDAIFGHERRRGHAPIGTWDQLGLAGEWSGRQLDLYGYDVDTGSGSFFRHAVLDDSAKLNWDRLRELGGGRPPDGAEAGRRILDALAANRFGIAVSSLAYARPHVKPLALAIDDRGPWIAATAESVVAREYPLTRVVSAWINRPPGQPVEPSLREFLRYVLSPEGQQEIARDGGFLPLGADAMRRQLASLE